MDVEARVERVRAAYEAVHAPLWRAVLAYSGSADVADEAVAEAFAQLLRRGDGVEIPPPGRGGRPSGSRPVS